MLKRILIIFITTTFVFTATTLPLKAAVLNLQENYVLTENEVLDEDLFIAAPSIDINGTINGNVYAAAGMITVKGKINGSLITAGGTIMITGEVQDQIIAAGGIITLSGAKIGSGCVTFGGMVNIDQTTEVQSSSIFAAGTYSHQGTTNREMLGAGGRVDLNGQIKGNATIGTDQLNLGSKTIINGNLKYYSDKEAVVDKEAQIKGETEKILHQLDQSAFSKENWTRIGYGLKIWSYLGILLIGFLLLKLLPKTADTISANIINQPWSSLGWGFTILIITIPALLIMGITLIGIPLAVILFFFFILALYLSKIFLGLMIGKAAVNYFKVKTNHYAALALGLGVFYLLTLIPYFGFFISLAAYVFGLGAAFIYLRQTLFS